MERLATSHEREIWFHELSRPYRVDAPFPRELYVCILFANDELVTKDEQRAVSEQLVGTGCRYAVCAGDQCWSWHMSVDLAYLATDEHFSPPDETFVMTSGHERDSVEDIIFFGLMCTMFDDHHFARYLVLFIGPDADLRDEVTKGVHKFWPDIRA